MSVICLCGIALIVVFLNVVFPVAVGVVIRLGDGGSAVVHVFTEPVHLEPVGQTVIVVITVFTTAKHRRFAEIHLPVLFELSADRHLAL